MEKLGNFEQIDKVLETWLPKYGLTVYKEYKEEAVRIVSVIDNCGSKYTLWLSPSMSGKIEVSGHNNLKGKNEKNFNILTDLESLSETLENAYKIIAAWISSNGHKRTWY